MRWLRRSLWLPSTPRYGQQRGLSKLAEAKARWNGRLIVSEEVEQALEAGGPVVALESTIITHGMPYPTNLSTALSVEKILRAQLCLPATIALLDGRVHIGLSAAQLERLADQQGREIKHKVSRRDLAAVLARREVGGTTVAGTMYIASSVGIGLFVTGGIGGVHRNGENSMDVSADLIELGRTPMAVVCAGAKSILDIPRTLEVLETQGVCVATYGPTKNFPAFYTPTSGSQSPWNVATPQEAARLVDAGLSLPHPLATLLAVPIPSEHATEGDKVQEAVEQAVRESVEQGIDKRGKEATPWLLKRVSELSGGASLLPNVKLIENNALVGGKVAFELSKLQAAKRGGSGFMPASTSPPSDTSNSTAAASGKQTAPLPPPQVIVFGSSAIDITSTSPHPLAPRTTTPGKVYLTPGGVGRNISEAAQNLLPPHAVQLVSPIGSSFITGSSEPTVDAFGKVLLNELDAVGLRTDGLTLVDGEKHGTSVCTLTLDEQQDLVVGVADMDVVETMTADDVEASITKAKPKLVVFDCNPTAEVISTIMCAARELDIPTLCDPTSIPKLPRLITALLSSPILPLSGTRILTHLSPNLLELDLLHSSLSPSALPSDMESDAWEYVNSLNLLSEWRAKVDTFCNSPTLHWITREGVIQKAVSCLPWIEHLWIKCGAEGLLHIGIEASSPPAPGSEVAGIRQGLDGPHAGKQLVVRHYPSLLVPPEEIVSTTGAGDTLVGGIVAGLMSNEEESVWVPRAMESVARTLRSQGAVG